MLSPRVILLAVTMLAVATALPTQDPDSIVPEVDFFGTPEVPPKQEMTSVSVKHDASCSEVAMADLEAAMKAQSVAGLPAACAACLQSTDNDGCGITHESMSHEEKQDVTEMTHDHGPCAPVCGTECQKAEDEFDITKDCKKCGECHRAQGSGEHAMSDESPAADAPAGTMQPAMTMPDGTHMPAGTMQPAMTMPDGTHMPAASESPAADAPAAEAPAASTPAAAASTAEAPAASESPAADASAGTMQPAMTMPDGTTMPAGTTMPDAARSDA